MHFILYLVGFACMAVLSTSLSIDPDCIARSLREPHVLGIQNHITSWIGDSSNILIITLEYGREHPYDYDYIEVKHDGMQLERFRDNKEKSVYYKNFTNNLNYGWLDIDFVAAKEYEINITSHNIYHEFIGESKIKLKKFTVEGSNITVNCKSDIIFWEIRRGVTLIPLKPNTTNVFSLFSRSDFQPILTAGNSSIKLGFKDNAINDILPYQVGYQKPLPKYKEHMVKISCTSYQLCTYKLGIDESQKIKKTFLKGLTNLAINGEGEEFFIRLNRSTHSIVNKTTQPISTEKPPIDGSTSAVIVLAVLLVIVVPATAFIVLYISRRQHKVLAVDLLAEMQPMLKQAPNSRNSFCSSGLNLQHQTRLWDAVTHNDIALVNHLLDSGKNPSNREVGMPTSPLDEAHLLGHKEIVKLFAYRLKSEQSVTTQDQIEITFKELEKRMERVFQAAKYGIYERGNGVNVLLNTHSLPGTIKDNNGWSLMHYMAAVKFSDERPAWEPVDIRNFFNHHIYYINAIDHWGYTPLHILAQHQGCRNIMWDGHTITIEKAWIEMAKLFVSYGCDPRISNHQNILPHELATRSGCHSMASYLKEKCEELGDIDHASAADKFDELVEAAKNNESDKIISLLKNHVPLLPILAQKDPLVEAIRNGHRDVVFLLICAGSPICNCSIDDLTPLEAAHNTLSLPALFPALIRKIHSDRLKAERSKVTQVDDLHKSLAVGIQNIQKTILKIGDKSRWQFTSESGDNRSEEARKLLVAASELGLSLTVQLLGMEEVELRPLPNEDSPVDKAQAGDYIDTLYALCRDLKMAPYATHKQSKILNRLESDLLIAECKIFKKYAIIDRVQLFIGLDEFKVQTFLNQACNQKESEHDWSLYDSSIFYMCARYGLIYLLKTYTKSNEIFKLDQVIQKFSETTMLHISVLYGQHHITEYLLYHGACPEKKTIGGYTAAHIAAIVGHKDSMNYIISYMKCKDIPTEDKCDLGMTATELIDQYDAMRKQCNYPFLKPKDAHKVKNEIREGDMALEILKGKAKTLNIKNQADLMNKVQELQQKRKEMKTSYVEDTIKETKLFFQDIDNELFKGNLKECGTHHEGHIIFHNDVVRFVFELETYNAYGDSKNVKIDTQSNGDSITLKLNTDTESDIFSNNNFIKKFIETIKNRIQIFKPSNAKVNLAPPFLIPHASGVVLYWACESNNSLNRVRVYIDPVIKSDLPEANGIKSFPEHIQKLCENVCAELHVTNLKGDWTYRGYSLETQIFGNLNENERLVWQVCRFIKLLSKRYWWAPTSNIRKSVQRLDVYSVGVTFPQERALKALFLEELAENPDKWGKDDIFDRVKGIYKRCLTVDNKENYHPVESVRSFLMPTTYNHKMSESVCGVFKYLEELNSDKLPRKSVQLKSPLRNQKFSFSE